MICATIIADSINQTGSRITTMMVTMPRIILAEFNTHRMFSRNSASSRAIPFPKMVKMVKENPFIPIAWQKDHKGMQGNEYFTDEKSIDKLNKNWLRARDNAINEIETYLKIEQYVDEKGEIVDVNLTKQLINRGLEQFMYHTVIVTATDWENFFYLRCPQYNINGDILRSKKDASQMYDLEYAPESTEWRRLNKGQAEIHMMALAEAMWDAYNESTPKQLEKDEWHIPFGDKIDETLIRNSLPIEISFSLMSPEDYFNLIDEYRLKIAVARCARVSYTVVGEEGKAENYANDFKLHDRLAASGHWSPMEHAAQNIESLEYSGNLKGYKQYRKTFTNENITK